MTQIDSNSEERNGPLPRAKWATHKHMEWLGNAHLVAGAGGMQVYWKGSSYSPYGYLILHADVLSPTLQGNGPWATRTWPTT